MVDDLLAYQSMFGSMLELISNVQEEGSSWDKQPFEKYFELMNRTSRIEGITEDQVEKFKNMIRETDMSFGAVNNLYAEIEEKVREAHRKGLIKDNWGRER